MCPTILATANPFFGWIFFFKYFPLSHTGSAIIACLASSFSAIFWALWFVLHAIGTAEKVLFGNVAQNWRSCIPPIEPPAAQRSLSIPKWSNNVSWDLTISLIVITGKFKPYASFVFLSISLGPHEPIHPPITFAHITKYLFVSIALPGPTAVTHQPSFLVIGFVPLTNWSPVNAWKIRIALSLFLFRLP